MDQNGPNMDHNEQTIIKNGPKMDKMFPQIDNKYKKWTENGVKI